MLRGIHKHNTILANLLQQVLIIIMCHLYSTGRLSWILSMTHYGMYMVGAQSLPR